MICKEHAGTVCQVFRIIIIRLVLRQEPFVKSLVHHQKTQLITESQQHGSRRVVGTADSVAAHIFKLLQPSLPTLPISHSACQAAVMVDAHSLYFYSLTV